jgi:hypothetical protein
VIVVCLPVAKLTVVRCKPLAEHGAEAIAFRSPNGKARNRAASPALNGSVERRVVPEIGPMSRLTLNV